MQMIPWYRQVLSLVYGLGVMLIALWALEQGSGPYVVLGVVAMSCLTLMLIFGVEINEIVLMDRIKIDFSNTSDDRGDTDADTDADRSDTPEPRMNDGD
jgi:hypothetical protein